MAFIQLQGHVHNSRRNDYCCAEVEGLYNYGASHAGLNSSWPLSSRRRPDTMTCSGLC